MVIRHIRFITGTLISSVVTDGERVQTVETPVTSLDSGQQSVIGDLVNFADGLMDADEAIEDASLSRSTAQPFDEGGDPLPPVDIIEAAVTVRGPLGMRTLTLTSDALGEELSDDLIALWEALEA